MSETLGIGFHREDGPSSRPGRLVVAAAVLAGLIAPLAGCSFGGSGGEGTVDIARAKGASAAPGSSTLKGAMVRERGGMGGAQKTGRR